MSTTPTITNLDLLVPEEDCGALPAVQISAATVAGVQSTRINYQGRVICLTQQLAQFYGCDPEHIWDNHRKNSDRFEEGKHFVRLDGETLKVFKEGLPEIIREPLKFAPKAILWTELGAARHAKMLTTDRAWDVFEQLEEAYFHQAGQPSTPAIDSHEGALLALQQLTVQQLALIQENKRTAAQLALAAPKVEYVDRYVAANGSMGFRQVAKLLQANEHGFRNWLHDEKILYRLAGVLTPYQNHIDAGRFVVKTGISQVGQNAFSQARFTPKGVEWIADLWMQHQVRQKQGGEVAV